MKNSTRIFPISLSSNESKNLLKTVCNALLQSAWWAIVNDSIDSHGILILKYKKSYSPFDVAVQIVTISGEKDKSEIVIDVKNRGTETDRYLDAIYTIKECIDFGLEDRWFYSTKDIKTESLSSAKEVRNNGISLEQDVLSLLNSMGLRASTTQTTRDGGIDIVAYNDNPIFKGKYVIQCKDWQNPVGESIIRELYGVVVSETASKGILITTGTITKPAQKFAEGKPLELIDGEQLSKLLHKFKPS